MIDEEADSALDDEQPTERAVVHRWARGQLWQGRRAVWRYHWTERRCRRAVLEAREKQQQERIDQRLSATSVEELARGTRVSLAALRRGGVTTAADVRARSAHDLETIHGIGQASAQKIKDVAARLAQISPGDLRPPANPDRWNPGDSALVRSLAMLALTTAVAPHAAALQQAMGTVRWLARATNWLAWLFSTPARKARVQSQVPEARRDWQSQSTQSLQDLLAGLDRARIGPVAESNGSGGRLWTGRI